MNTNLLDMESTFDRKEIDPIWHLHDDLSVDDAAALVAEEDPGWVEQCKNDSNFEMRFPRVIAAKKAITSAINAGKLEAVKRYRIANVIQAEEQRNYDLHAFEDAWDTAKNEDDAIYFISRVPDWTTTTIELENLRAWLRSRGKDDGFFFKAESKTPGYLDRDHPRYSARLAAAVNAWINFKEIPGKSVKSALEKWLREHAAEYEMVSEDGNPSTKPVDECSTIANWDRKGGAPKTPAA